MGGGGREGRSYRSRTQRKHFKQSRENVWKRSKSDPDSTDGHASPWQPFATQNPSFDEYYKVYFTCFPWCILQVSFYIYLFCFLNALMSLCNYRSKGLWLLKNGTGLSKFFVSHCLLLLESILGNYKKYFWHIFFFILKLLLLVSSLSYVLFYFKLWSAQSSFTRNILKANYNYFWCCWELNLFNNWVNLE